MIIDYWLAGHMGRAWLRLRPRLRAKGAGLPGLCQSVAQGQRLPAGQLWRVQNFAVWIWARAMMAAVLLMGVIGMTTKLLAPPGRVPWLVDAVVLALICFMAIAGGQVVMLRYRSNRNRYYQRKVRAVASQDPLPPRSPGQPRRADFWVATTLAVVMFAVIGYFGLHSATH